MTDDDVKAMLARRAEDVHVSPDAWDAIAARLDEPRHSSRRLAALAGAAVAAALVAGVIVVAQNDSPAPPVTASTTSVPQPAALPSHVWEGEPWQDAASVAETYLKVRTGVQVTTADYDFTNVDHGVGRFANGGVATELWLERVGGRWLVTSAASDLVPIFNAHVEGPELVADVTPELDGTLWLGFGGPFDEWDAPRDVKARESVHVRQVATGSFRALLRTADGTVGLSEVVPAGDPSQPKGEIVHVWPATDADGMVVLQEEATLGRRPDLLDPRAVAGAYLSDALRLRTPFSVSEFQQGDARSGEVPFALDGEPAGVVLVRQMADGTIWYVAGVVSPILEITRTEQKADEGLRVHVRTGAGSQVSVSVRNPGDDGGIEATREVNPAGDTVAVDVEGARQNLWVQVILHGEDGIIAIAVAPVS